MYIRNFAPDRWPLGIPVAVTAASAPPQDELESNTYAAFADMDASPTKAWLIAHRNDAEWKRFYTLAFERRPAEELYDLRNDPHQTKNVAADAKYATTKARLAAQLMKTLKDAGDPRVTGDGQTFERPPVHRSKSATAAAKQAVTIVRSLRFSPVRRRRKRS